MSKSYENKKVYRQSLKKMAKDGYINDASGKMVKKSQLQDSSMKRDYFPQQS